MKLLLLGPQGSGKGTQAKIIASNLGLVHISTGDLLRSATGKLRVEIDSYITHGNLVPDELMLRLLDEKLKKLDYCNFILDGFPRNLAQAKMLDSLVQVDKAIEIHIPDEETVRRLSGRYNCKKCGAIYNIATSPKPKKKGLCDICNIPLYQRDDDKPEAIKKRLAIYHSETSPVIVHYHAIRINGNQSIEKVTQDILKVL